MQHSYREQVIAFAGIWQAAKLVQQVARQGKADNADMAVCIKSLFEMNPATTEAVYGELKGLTTGLNTILDQFGDATNQRDMELTKYVIALMHLERKLMQQPEMLEKISRGLELAKSQAEHFGSSTHENVIANIGDLYSNTISTLTPKIIVQGEQGYLSNSANAAKVRTLLLAGIRSTVLWYQCGGRRLGLIFSRKKLLNQTKALLSETI
jgi:high frequency lysogenization protein